MEIQSMRWADIEKKGVIITGTRGAQIGTPHGAESVYWKEQEDFLTAGGTIEDIIPAPEDIGPDSP